MTTPLMSVVASRASRKTLRTAVSVRWVKASVHWAKSLALTTVGQDAHRQLHAKHHAFGLRLGRGQGLFAATGFGLQTGPIGRGHGL